MPPRFRGDGQSGICRKLQKATQRPPIDHSRKSATGKGTGNPFTRAVFGGSSSTRAKKFPIPFFLRCFYSSDDRGGESPLFFYFKRQTAGADIIRAVDYVR